MFLSLSKLHTLKLYNFQKLFNFYLFSTRKMANKFAEKWGIIHDKILSDFWKLTKNGHQIKKSSEMKKSFKLQKNILSNLIFIIEFI